MMFAVAVVWVDDVRVGFPKSYQMSSNIYLALVPTAFRQSRQLEPGFRVWTQTQAMDVQYATAGHVYGW